MVTEHGSDLSCPHPCIYADAAPSWLENELLDMEQCPVLLRTGLGEHCLFTLTRSGYASMVSASPAETQVGLVWTQLCLLLAT